MLLIMAKEKVFQQRTQKMAQMSNEEIHRGVNEIRINRPDAACGRFESIVNSVSFIYQTDKRFQPYFDIFQRCVYTAAFGMGLARGLLTEKAPSSNEPYTVEQLSRYDAFQDHLDLGKSFAALRKEACGMELLESGLYYDKISRLNRTF